jgi:hypothetical protein
MAMLTGGPLARSDLEFQQLARTVDTIRGAGIDRIGLLGKNS